MIICMANFINDFNQNRITLKINIGRLKINWEVGVMAQWLRSFNALAKDLYSVHSMHVMYRHTCKQTLIHIKINLYFFFFKKTA